MADRREERPVVALLDVMPQPSRDAIVAAFGAGFEVRCAEEGTREELLDLIRPATALLAMWGGVDREMIEAGPRVRVIQKLGVGVDKIDVPAAAERGITVLKAAGINADAVAEMVVLLVLALGRNLISGVLGYREGRFEKEALRARSFQLLGKTIGLYGFGHIGVQVARRMRPFGTSVLYHDVRRAAPELEAELGARWVPFDELLTSSDIVSLHAPSTPETVGRFDSDAFGKMKNTALLINTARGALVDEDALTKALEQGEILGAGLDVTHQEPIRPDSPLFAFDQVILTPHLGGAVADNFPRVAARAHENVSAVLSGRAPAAADVVSAP